ncbi:MAG TPA: CvpA family protein [Xanthomonadaceae bacterium]|nr:CvpA family protein [Xanthomonadaceae bacterium]
MSAVDWALLGVVALSALMGAMRGIVVEVLSVVVWLAAFWLAFAYGAEVAGLLLQQVHDPAARLFAAYALVFIAALIIGSVVTWLIGTLVRSVGLGGIDRLLGLMFGAVRGCALACVLVLVLGLTGLPQEPAWHESPLIPEFQHGAEWMKAWLPESAAQHVNFDAVVEQGKKKVLQTLLDKQMPKSRHKDASSQPD